MHILTLFFIGLVIILLQVYFNMKSKKNKEIRLSYVKKDLKVSQTISLKKNQKKPRSSFSHILDNLSMLDWSNENCLELDKKNMFDLGEEHKSLFKKEMQNSNESRNTSFDSTDFLIKKLRK